MASYGLVDMHISESDGPLRGGCVNDEGHETTEENILRSLCDPLLAFRVVAAGRRIFLVACSLGLGSFACLLVCFRSPGLRVAVHLLHGLAWRGCSADFLFAAS